MIRDSIRVSVMAGVMAVPAAAHAQDVVMQWNDIARRYVVVQPYSPVEQTRLMALVHVAIHDALNGVEGRYDQYGDHGKAPAGSSVAAAVIAAAFGTLSAELGPTAPLVDEYAASLAAHAISPLDPGLAYGQSIADALMATRHRSVDGAAAAAFPYAAPGAGLPGVWTPQPGATALLPGWGRVTTFVLREASQFRPDPPPALTSEQYARDYNEVLRLGARTGHARTQEQTNIALFWRASPTAIWNPILRTAVTIRGLSLPEKARVMALFYLAAADASIACWEAKYHYNFWRPEPAILNGALDGNDATAGALWTPHLPTAPHPEYPSAHTSNSSAMAHILQSFFGDAPGFIIEATSSQNAGFVRRWRTFSEGVDEVIDARIYSGIHFRTADETGARLGRQVAQFVLTHALRPVRPASGRELP